MGIKFRILNLSKARETYRHNKHPWHTEVECLDTGKVYYSISECAREVQGDLNYLLECISNHRLYRGACYARTKDILNNNWDKELYRKWVHDRKDAANVRDPTKQQELEEYGRELFGIDERRYK